LARIWDSLVSKFQPEDGRLDTDIHTYPEEKVSMLLSTTKSSSILDSRGISINTMVPDQDFHLDADAKGLFTWLNCTPCHLNRTQKNKSYLGVYLNSSRCISAIRNLHGLHYTKFESEFRNYMVNGNTPLHQAMRGRGSECDKLAMAWATFVKDKLGNDERYTWKRAYLELEEFDGIIAGLSVVHFGARYPLLFGADCESDRIPESTHVRLHSYVGRRIDESRDDPQATTVDLRRHPVYQSALQFIDREPFRRLYFSESSQFAAANPPSSTDAHPQTKRRRGEAPGTVSPQQRKI